MSVDFYFEVKKKNDLIHINLMKAEINYGGLLYIFLTVIIDI